MGSGTLEEALAWVEYCNLRPTDGVGAAAERGWLVGPHRVRYWAFGNEMYGEGQVGSLSAQEYVAEAKRWARAIKLRRPNASACLVWEKRVVQLGHVRDRRARQPGRLALGAHLYRLGRLLDQRAGAS